MDIVTEVCLALCAIAGFTVGVVYFLHRVFSKVYKRGFDRGWNYAHSIEYKRGFQDGENKVRRDLFERHVKGLDTTVDM